MSEHTAISWADSTWSPWEGCTQVSPACDHCYAKRMNVRFRKGENWGPGAPRRLYDDEHWDKPVRWNAAAAKAGKVRSVFPSVCDPFDNEVDPALRERFFALIGATPNLRWLLLTKRIGNVPGMVALIPGWLPPNVWLGATVCNQAEADRDIPKLLAVPARVRFLSIEPMLGPVDLHDHLMRQVNGFTQRIDWVICGGESGPQARPMHPGWVRSLRDQCAAAGVPFHFKQWGEWVTDSDLPDQTNDSLYTADLSRQRVRWVAIGPDGRTSDRDADDVGPGGESLNRVGTKAAGRLLDGIEHNGFPT